MGIKDLLNALLGGSGRKSPVEDLVISAVADTLGEKGGGRLRSQAALINKVQRLAEWKEVNFYSLRNGKPWFDESLRFPLAIPEAKLASVTLAAVNEPVTRNADLWLVNGWIFSISFDKAMKGLQDKAWKSRKVRIFMDPFETMERGQSPSAARLADAFGVEVEAILPGSIKGPAMRKGRLLAPADLGFDLPGDAAALLSLTGGFRIGDIEVLGVDCIRQVVSEEVSYAILAEAASGALLAYALEPDSGKFLLLLPETNERITLAGGFTASFKKFLDEASKG